MHKVIWRYLEYQVEHHMWSTEDLIRGEAEEPARALPLLLSGGTNWAAALGSWRASRRPCSGKVFGKSKEVLQRELERRWDGIGESVHRRAARAMA